MTPVYIYWYIYIYITETLRREILQAVLNAHLYYNRLRPWNWNLTLLQFLLLLFCCSNAVRYMSNFNLGVLPVVANIYALRVNLSVAIVSMTSNRTVVVNGTKMVSHVWLFLLLYNYNLDDENDGGCWVMSEGVRWGILSYTWDKMAKICHGREDTMG